jgi:hypothetical protein
MQEVSGSIPLFSTKKALYFIGSMVLFFFTEADFGGCIASPAPFLGFCRRSSYAPAIPRYATNERHLRLGTAQTETPLFSFFERYYS